jgi:hypothetical protein
LPLATIAFPRGTATTFCSEIQERIQVSKNTQTRNGEIVSIKYALPGGGQGAEKKAVLF